MLSLFALHNLHQAVSDEKAQLSVKLRAVFDIAVNIADSQLREDAPGVLQRAQENGVQQCLLVGCDLDESTWLAKQHGLLNQPWTAGVHPHYVSQASDDYLDTLRRLQILPGCVAVGECGLDYFRMLSPKLQQQSACEAQLSLAVELNKPAYLHDRDASQDLIAIISNQPEVKGVVHCFTSDYSSLESYLDLGLMIGITGWCLDERRGQELAQLVPAIPADRLLVETDAPYLTPRTLRPRPKRNEPQFLPHIIEGIARLRGCDAQELADQTTHNARTLFQC